MPNIHIEKSETDEPTKWDMTSEEWQQLQRLNYLNTFVRPNSNICPECYHELTTTEDEDETICTGCGLIVSMSIEYVAGHKIILPYGRH